MQGSKIKIIALVFLIVIVAGGAFFFVSGSSNGKPNSEVQFKEVQVRRGNLRIIVSANGAVQPIDRIEIKSKASGEIVELSVDQGDFIRRGELIARLDQRDERAAVAQAQADLDIAKAELEQADRTFERRNQLFEKNLISVEERDQMELSLAIARSKLIQATTTLDRAKERLSESVVRAPTDGIILQKYVEKGQIIASGVNSVSGGTPIVDIADMRSVYVAAGIDEIDIGKIEIGQPAVVVAEAYPDQKFKGQIVRIAPEARVDQNVTLFDVIVKVDNEESKLKSGMNASIEIYILSKDNVLLAPAIAFQSVRDPQAKANERVVLVKDGNQSVTKTVTTGLSDFRQIEILDGLQEGDVLLIAMTSRLKAENERMEERIRSSRSFGVANRSSQN